MTRKPKRIRPYEALRRLMAQMNITQRELVDEWNDQTMSNMGYTYLSEMLNGKRAIKMEFAYFVLDYLDIPHHQLHEYFPKGGYSA